MTTYLSYEAVVRINAEHGGPGAGVRDEGGIRAALGRAEASFGGAELYPTIARKAAVILHGLSSTQCFHDGNKRTAWLAATLFLALNGAPLRRCPVIAAEAIVLAVATKAFEVDGDPHLAVEKAAEWLREHTLTARDRYHFAFLAMGSHVQDDTISVAHGLIGFLRVDTLPVDVELSLVMHIRWLAEDLGRQHSLTVYIEDDMIAATSFPTPQSTADHVDGVWSTYELAPTRRFTLACEPMPTESAHHPEGVSPEILSIPVGLRLLRPGLTWLCVELDGTEFARVPVDVQLAAYLA